MDKGEGLALLLEEAQTLGIPLSPQQVGDLLAYGSRILEANRNISLTAIVDFREMVIKHLLDSLSGLTAVDIREGQQVMDVGTGGGFPGIPLKIARPRCRLTLVDSTAKKLAAVQGALAGMDLPGVDFCHGRAEEMGKGAPWRESQDLVVSRAVAHLRVLVEYCLPLVKVGGSFLAYKGPEGRQEMEEARRALDLLGGSPPLVKELILPGGHHRALIRIEKTRPGASQYPRSSGQIKKKPL